MGLQRSLAEIVDGGIAWVALGQVTEIEAHPAYGYLVLVDIRPSGQSVQARMAFPGCRGNLGIFWPIDIGDEVLVLFPAGDPNEAIAFGVPASAEAQPPVDWNNDTIRIEGAGDLQIEVVSDNVMLGSATAVDYVALAAKVEAQLTALRDTINAWVPVPSDGGSALKAALTTLFATWPGDVGATKVKAE